MKNKHDFSFSTDEQLIFKHDVLVRIKLCGYLVDIDTILIPETNNIWFTDFVHSLGKPVVVLKKRSISELLYLLDMQFMQKAERTKLYASMKNMDTIKMAEIAGNHRKYFISCLFYSL